MLSWIRFGDDRARRIAAVEEHAREHATKELAPMVEETIDKVQGPAVVLDRNPDYQRASKASGGDPRIPAWELKRQEIESKLPSSHSPLLLVSAILGLGAAELASMNDLLRQQGIENPTRIIVAMSAVCVLFFLTYKLKDSTNKKPFVLTIVGIIVFVFGISILRHDQVAVEGESPLTAIATTAFLTVVSIGPSFVTKHLIALFDAARELRRDRRRITRELNRALTAQAAAIKESQEWERRREYDIQERAILRNAYKLAYLEAGGKGSFNEPMAQPPTPQQPRPHIPAVGSQPSPLTATLYNPYQKPGNGKDQP